MNLLFKTLWIGEGIGLVLGLILNIILVFAIYRTSTKKLQNYSYLFLVGAIFDIFFSVTEIATQHQLQIARGTLFVMPHGFERYLPVWTYPIFMAPHGFVLLHGLYILAPQYHYRYLLATNGNAPVQVLLRDIGITSSMAFVSGLGLGWGSVQGLYKRGFDYYMQFVEPQWMEETDNSTYFRYACDTSDLGPQIFFYSGCLGSTICTFVVIYYGYKSFSFVNVGTSGASKRTRDLQNQFTRTLIAQTVSAFCFAFVPISIFVFCVAFQVNGKMLGTGVMSPISWLAFSNALIAIIVVKDYRYYTLSLFGIKRAQVKDASAGASVTANTMSVNQTEGETGNNDLMIV